MNDLISRSAIYNKIAELEELARDRVLDTPTNSPCYERYVSQLNERRALKHLIADEPTAYDVDKAVEQLEERKNYLLKEFVLAEKAREVKEKSLARINEIDGIIKNVKAGGKND